MRDKVKTLANRAVPAAILLSAFLPAAVSADENTSALHGYSLTIGIAVKELSFDYYRNADDTNPAGTMTEGMYTTYLLRANSAYTLSRNHRWGYFFETGLSSFSMNKQNRGSEEVDLGTSVKGNYWYITPVGFYLFGAPPRGRKELSVIAGVGAGVGYLSAKGDMILTEDGSNELHKVDTQGFDIAASILLEARYGKWSSRILGGGPFLDAGNSTYSAFSFTWDIGYTFMF